MKVLVFLLTLTVSLALATAKVHVQGHRGARAVMPENTIEGFQYALELGVDVLELDLAVSKDRQVIISHDPVVNTALCSNFEGERVPFYTLTIGQIKEIDCGSKANPRFPKQKRVTGARIPILAELFEWVQKSTLPRARTVQFNIEIKTFPQYPALTPEPHEFARLVYDVVKKFGMVDRTIVQSFDYRSLEAAKSLDSRLRISFLNDRSLPDFVAIAQKLKAEYISPNQHWMVKEQVVSLQQVGVKTIPWTANTEEEWERLVQLGVDGIITDDPAGLIGYLQRKGLR